MARRHLREMGTSLFFRFDETSTIAPVDYGKDGMTILDAILPTAEDVSDQDLPFDYCRTFDGSTNYIRITNVVHRYTLWVSMWLYVDQINESEYESIYYATNEFHFRVRTDGYLEGIVWTTESGSTVDHRISYDITSRLQEWLYVTWSYSMNSFVMWVNGEEVDRDDTPNGYQIRQAATRRYIGGLVNNNFFDGKIAEFIHNDSAGAAFLHCNTYLASKDSSLGFEVESDSIAVYNFDDDYGTTVVDDTGNHDGVIHGSPTVINAPWGKKAGAKGYSFNGSSANYLTIPHSTDFDLDFGKGLTVEILGKRTVSGSMINKHTLSTPFYGWEVRSTGAIVGKIAGGIDNECALTDTYSFYSAVVFDGHRQYMYIYTGGYVVSFGLYEPENWNVVSNTGDIYISKRPDNTDVFTGELYGIRITGRAKDMQEIIAFHGTANPGVTF